MDRPARVSGELVGVRDGRALKGFQMRKIAQIASTILVFHSVQCWANDPVQIQVIPDLSLDEIGLFWQDEVLESIIQKKMNAIRAGERPIIRIMDRMDGRPGFHQFDSHHTAEAYRRLEIKSVRAQHYSPDQAKRMGIYNAETYPKHCFSSPPKVVDSFTPRSPFAASATPGEAVSCIAKPNPSGSIFKYESYSNNMSRMAPSGPPSALGPALAWAGGTVQYVQFGTGENYGDELALTLMNPVADMHLVYGSGTPQTQNLIDSGATKWANTRAKRYKFNALSDSEAMAELESAIRGWGKYKEIPRYIRTQLQIKLDRVKPGSYQIKELYRRYIWNFIYQ